MRLKRLFMMFALLLVITSIPALAQDKVITGKVTDLSNGQPVSGASVLVKGTSIGTQTKADGTFSLNAPASATTIVISYVGYATQELLIGSGSMSISLIQSSSALNDVVVVAYGTRKKGDLTGAVTSVSAKDFQKGVINSSEQLLQGKVAGLQVTSGGGSAGVRSGDKRDHQHAHRFRRQSQAETGDRNKLDCGCRLRSGCDTRPTPERNVLPNSLQRAHHDSPNGWT